MSAASPRNRPGLAALAYRAGTHASFKQALAAALSRPGALRALQTRADDDASIALLDAWAAVLDVLAFYQERIANEGYLGTATERRSVLELARAIGYELNPGVAAGTYLAFTVEDAAGSPGIATIGAGVKAQSVPRPRELPQTFETVEPLAARAAWNALAPRPTSLKFPRDKDESLYLAGTSTNVEQGDMLLIVGDERGKSVASPYWELRRVTAVTPQHAARRTLVHWQEPLGSIAPHHAPLLNPKVFVFRQRASIFGHNAPEWRTLPNTMKASYLGLDDPKDLVGAEKAQWPNFEIFAPSGQLVAPGPRSQIIPPTVDEVAGAANAAADGVAKSAVRDALGAGMNTVTSLGGVATTAVDMAVNSARALETVATTAADTVANTARNEIQGRLTSLTAFVRSASQAAAGNARATVDLAIGRLEASLVTMAAEFQSASPAAAAAAVLRRLLTTIENIRSATVAGLQNIATARAAAQAVLDAALASVRTRLGYLNANLADLAGDARTWVEGIIAHGPLGAAKAALTTARDDIAAISVTGYSDQSLAGAVEGIVTSIKTALTPSTPPTELERALRDILVNPFETIVNRVFALIRQTIANAADVTASATTLAESFTSTAGVLLAEAQRSIQNIAEDVTATALAAARAVNPADALRELGEAAGKSRDAARGAAGALSGAAAANGAATAIAIAVKGGLTLGGQTPESIGRTAKDAAAAAVVVAPIITRAAVIAALTGAAVGTLAITGAVAASGIVVAPAIMATFIAGGAVFGTSGLLLGAAAGGAGAAGAITASTLLGGAAFAGAMPAATVLGLGVVELTENVLVPAATKAATEVQTEVGIAVDAMFPGTAKEIPPRNPQPVPSTDTIDLDAVYRKILPKSWIVLSTPAHTELYRVTRVREASRAEFTLTSKTSRVTLDGPHLRDYFRFAVREAIVFAVSDELALAETPIPDPVTGAAITLDRRIDGLPPLRTLIVSGTDAGGAAAAEVATVDYAELEGALTRLVLTSSLRRSYRRDSVTIYGNVAAATHGETYREVLGHGDASRAFQAFRLKQKPLTHVAAPNPRGAETTLEVYVDDVRWDEVPSLHGRGPRDRVYTTRIDDDGTVTVQFGDGLTGARLPTGQENVVATYRAGIGLAGLVDAGQITTLATRPLGVAAVRNPLAPEGGDDPESLAGARENAPLTVLTIDRIVSLRDFEDFARAFGGIGKAQAVALWVGERHVVHLTVAAADGGALDPNQRAFENLRAGIDGARDPVQSVLIASYEPGLTFEVEANVRVHARYRRDKVFPAVRAALLAAFSFDARAFAQPVTKSEVLAVVQGVAGVEAVDLDALYVTRAARTVETRLFARPARVEEDATGRRIEAAELLTVNPDGIRLEEMTA